MTRRRVRRVPPPPVPAFTFAPQWLTLRGAAYDLGVSVDTVKRLIKAGRLRSYLIPGTRLRRIARADVRAFVRDRAPDTREEV
jgi:excisionase family DNA binding protein